MSNSQPATIQEIEKTIGHTINQLLGVNICVTCRGGDLAEKWTVSGLPVDAVNAVEWMKKNLNFQIEDSVYDEELEESFIYLTR